MSIKRPFIWAHRGASGIESENTMGAFRKALELGADGVETDGYCTADSQVVLSHDGAINRDGRKVAIRNLTLAELKETLDEQMFPTFGELLSEFQPKKVPISIDVRDLTTARQLIQILDSQHAFPLVEICLDTERNVKKVRELSDVAIIVFSPALAWPSKEVVDRIQANLDLFEDNHVKAVNFTWSYYTSHPSLLPIIHREGHMLAYAWDVHLKSVIQKVLPLGLDAIYTNYPDRLKSLVDALMH